MQDSILKEESKVFAKNVIFLCRDLEKDRTAWILARQFLRSGTSIGANIHEAVYAQSTSDFLSKLEIALKECHESEYWLDLILESGFINEERGKSLLHQCGTLRRMLVASCRTIKRQKTDSVR